MPLSINDFTTSYKPTWCAGCGNSAIWIALRRAYVELGIRPHQIMNVYDIGCCGNGGNWMRSYGYHSLHGRSLPLAIGIKLANSRLNVMSFAGDGGALGEGGNHFMHGCRTNIDITFVIHNNQLYSLTTGQMAPTSEKGMKTKTSPKGDPLQQLKHLQIAISSGATFVARGYADDIPELINLMTAAIQHKGFSVLDIIQPCPTFNLQNTREWYLKHLKKLDPKAWNSQDKEKALLIAGTWSEGIPIGILYQKDWPTLHEVIPALSGEPLVHQVKPYDVKELLKEFQ